jgi:hypothetical protein
MHSTAAGQTECGVVRHWVSVLSQEQRKSEGGLRRREYL